MLTTDHVRAVIASYVARFPGQAGYVDPLLTMMNDGADALSRKEFRGHVTCGAWVINPQNHLLVIRHNALNRWLTPGGHVELSDASLFEGALRELQEEVGLKPQSLWAPVHCLSTPVHIDCHGIPANPKKGEPAHNHWDFRYLFLLRDTHAFELQLEEVSEVRWEPLDEAEETVANAIRIALAA